MGKIGHPVASIPAPVGFSDDFATRLAVEG